MIGLAEAGKVKTVIVKDMSRMGRDYLKVGYYTESFFAERDIRYIAINDGVDSDKGDNDFTPFRNLFNDFYARDTYRKGKRRRTHGEAALRIFEEQGQSETMGCRRRSRRSSQEDICSLCGRERPYADCKNAAKGKNLDDKILLRKMRRKAFAGQSVFMGRKLCFQDFSAF